MTVAVCFDFGLTIIDFNGWIVAIPVDEKEKLK